MFTCVLCEKEWCYFQSFCPSCRVIKNIGNSYGFGEIKEVLETVCLRNKKQRKYKEDDIKKEKENHGDEIYTEPPKTRSKTVEKKN